MQAIVLVGGEGTRLRPLTETVPKPALTLVDRPFLAYMIEWLAGHGVTEVVLACGFLPDVLREALGGEEERAGVRIRYVAEPEPLGTAGAIRFAADALGEELDERFLALNGDVLTDLDLTRAAARRTRSGARARRSACTRSRTPRPSAWCESGEEGEVLEFLEKTGEREPGEVNAGMYVLERSVLDLIPPGENVSIERDVFPRLVGDGPARPAARGLLDGHRHAGALPAGELGHPRGRGRDAGRADGPGVLVDAGAEVDADATVGPRAVVGPGCRIGAGAEVLDSVLLDGCPRRRGRPRRSARSSPPGAEVPAGAEVEGAVAAEDERVPS